MKQYTQREFIKVCVANGFYYDRHSGDHAIYVNDMGRHVSIPSNLESVIARRLIKENNLEVDIKKLKRSRRMGILSDNLPAGSENSPNAPWNQHSNPEREIEVLVSITLSKIVKIKVSDYEITESGKDENGEYFEEVDYSNCDLKSAVEEQVLLPQEAYSTQLKETKACRDLKDWEVDEFIVMEE